MKILAKDPAVYLASVLILLSIISLSGCAPIERTFQDNWVKSVQEGKLTMAPGYDANWDGPPFRPTSHK